MLHVAAAPELFDRILWSGASEARREELAQLVATQVGADFKYVGLRRYLGAEVPVAVFSHVSAGEFSLIPGGGFDMGLSPEEEESVRAAREQRANDDDFDQEFDLLLSEIGQMRPLHRVVVAPFLIAQRVLEVGQAQRWLANLRDPLYGDVQRAAAHLTSEQITAVLVGTGLRLPAEAELEYAARAGLARKLLPWGDRLPDDATVEAMLADQEDLTNNAFGLHGYGLYPELCADNWRDHYRGAPDDGSPWVGSGMHVVRGGAGDCYPWEGHGEWNLLLCAMRMNEHAAEYGASVRLVRGLLEGDELDMSEGAGVTAAETAVAQESPKKAAKKPAKAAKTKTAAKKVAKTAAKKDAKTKASKKVAELAKKAGKKAASKKPAKKAASKKPAKKAASKQKSARS